MNPHPHFGIVPQFVTDQATGQLFMITQNSYSYGIGAPQPVPQMVHPQQLFQQQPVPLPLSLPAAIQPPVATTTNSTVAITQSPSKEVQHSSLNKQKGITERHSIAHYIGGQLMIETSKILSEKKSKKKKQQHLLKQHQPQHQQSKQQQQQQIRQPSPQTKPKQEPQQQHAHDHSLTQPSNDKQENDILKIRAEMPKWSVDEVVEFIKQHEDIKQYSSKFFDDEVDGKALLIMIDRNLNFQVLTSMFKHGPAMKIEAALSKYKLND